MTSQNAEHQTLVRVSQIKMLTPTIKEFTLVSDESGLSAFSPGAHVVVHMPGATRTIKNAYSLLSDPQDTSAYKIAVRLQDDSRGGSKFMHESLNEGDTLAISPPANLFAPYWLAKRHVLIAGGVGITPFMSYLPELERRGANFELHYCFRGSLTGAYKARLKAELDSSYFEYDSDAGGSLDVSSLFSGRTLGTHFYICGPASLITAVQAAAKEHGVPDKAIHFEEFAAPEPGAPFEVEAQKSGKLVQVGAEQSLLEALEAANIEVPNLCRGGVCGQCVCEVSAGEPDHRDNFLSTAEKQSAKTIMPCVSRAKSARLVMPI